MENDQEVVLFETQSTNTGHAIGIITLNDPKALNALSIDMCHLIKAQLSRWQNNDNIVAILMQGSGDKAFCAGGNIRKLYESMVDRVPFSGEINPYAEEFFANEYRLCRQLQFYNKPIIAWVDGIAMGGGMGLVAMASHRIATEKTRFAMPEINIGLYPDATGSWFLQRMPAKSGLFLGLTGANCNGADALLTNIAEYALTSDEKDVLIDALTNANWMDDTGQLNDLFETTSFALSKIHHSDHLSNSHIAKHWQFINKIVNAGSIHDIDSLLRDDLLKQKYCEDEWLTAAITSYVQGCPVTAALTFKIFKRSKKLSLEQILYMELNICLNCADYPDFREGVRALLIDKDRNPKWSRTLSECTEEYICSHFHSPYDKGQHPFELWLDKESLAVQLLKH